MAVEFDKQGFAGRFPGRFNWDTFKLSIADVQANTICDCCQAVVGHQETLASLPRPAGISGKAAIELLDHRPAAFHDPRLIIRRGYGFQIRLRAKWQEQGLAEF